MDLYRIYTDVIGIAILVSWGLFRSDSKLSYLFYLLYLTDL